MDNISMNNMKFHNKITNISTGVVFGTDSNASSITIEFDATGTFTANFEAQGTSGKFYPIMAVNLGTMNMATSTTDKNYLYQISTIGVIAIRVNVVAITGELTVYGNVRG